MGFSVNNFKHKIHSFLTKNRFSDARFRKDYLALIRIGCFGGISLSIGNLIILLTIFDDIAYPIILSFVPLILTVLFCVSYFQKKYFHVTVGIFCFTEIVMFTLYTLWFGTDIGYHLGIIFLSFVIFYETDTLKNKYVDLIISSVFIIYSYVLWAFVTFTGPVLFVLREDMFVLSVGFMLWLGISVMTFALFYHMKFARNEEALLRYNDKLRELVKHDELTKLQNRRGILEYVDKLNKKASVLYFVMCDIDFFKKVNDTYGHDIGDRVLVRVSKIISESLNKNSLVGRWGGEEFLIVISDDNQQDVWELVENIRLKISKEKYVVAEGREFFVTMTFGMVEHYPEKHSVDESIKKADENLYFGKQNGRDCVIF